MFCCSPSASHAFARFKTIFTSALILILPDPAHQFVVEVDTLDSDVWAILSHRSPTDNRLHSCAFFSCCPSSAEKNYEISDKELLAIKLALKEWSHWLEGAKHPFLVLTNHENLDNSKKTKLLTVLVVTLLQQI